LVVTGLSFAHIGPLSRTSQEIPLHSINKTTALQVVDLKKSDKGTSDVEITLLNASNKTITAYALLVGSGGIVTDLALSRDGALAPGQQKVESVPFGNFEAAAAQDSRRAGELTVSAVAFEGGEGEGDAQHLRMIWERRLGAKEQMALMLPLLQKSVSSSDDDPDRLVLELESLPPLAEGPKVSVDRKEAREDARAALVSELNMLKKWTHGEPNSNYRASLNRLTGRYSSMLTKL